MEKENLGHAKWKRQDSYLRKDDLNIKNMKQAIENCGEALKRFLLKMTTHDHTKKNQKHEKCHILLYHTSCQKMYAQKYLIHSLF